MSDDRTLFADRVSATKEEIRAAVTFQIQRYVEEEVKSGFEPTWEEFVKIYYEWDREHLHPFIAGEVNRIATYLLGSREAI